MIISIDAKKNWKIQHPFIFKTFNILCIEEMFLDLIKATYEKPTGYILTVKGWPLYPCDLEQKISALTNSILQYTRGSIKAIEKEKEITEIQIGKEEVNLSLFADYIILYIDNPKESLKKLLKCINKFRKLVRDKINLWKSIEFLYTNNKQSEKQIRNNFIYNSIKNKTLGIYLTEEV